MKLRTLHTVADPFQYGRNHKTGGAYWTIIRAQNPGLHPVEGHIFDRTVGGIIPLIFRDHILEGGQQT